MNKKILVIALGAAVTATIGVAQAARPTFYAGGDIIRVTTKIDDKNNVPPDVSGSAKAITLRLKGGVRLLEWLDAEVHIVLPQSETYSNAGGANMVETTVIGLFAKPYVNVGPVNIYALAGLARTNVSFDGNIIGSAIKSDLAYGAGVQYVFTKSISASADYTHYLKTNLPLVFSAGGLDVNVNAIGVGVTYTFK